MEQASCCCAPARPDAEATTPRVAEVGTVAASAPAADTVLIPGGLASTGTRKAVHDSDGEAPVRQVRLQPFRMDRAAVTNRRFAAFVAATSYVTDAERFGWSFVFYDMLPDGFSTRGAAGIEWWRSVEGAAWNHPEGPDTTLEGREEHPVTHVSWNDATAFAAWAGGRLPTEAEWEHAARGGLRDAIYPWGDREPDDHSFMPCNIWQGEFPHRNTSADGYAWIAPAISFAPNGYGLFNMAGNTWEWCADKWRIRSLKQRAKAANAEAARLDQRLMKGGSFLCHRSYCHRYRIAARHGNTPDTSTSHIGLRLVYPAAGA